MTIGARLREERLRLTLSQRALAKAGSVEANAQQHYEDASRSPEANYLAAIATAGVDMLYVLTGERHLRPLNTDQQARLTVSFAL